MPHHEAQPLAERFWLIERSKPPVNMALLSEQRLSQPQVTRKPQKNKTVTAWLNAY
jgi:hypothetical protein